MPVRQWFPRAAANHCYQYRRAGSNLVCTDNEEPDYVSVLAAAHAQEKVLVYEEGSRATCRQLRESSRIQTSVVII
jgi:hypothetical protein